MLSPGGAATFFYDAENIIAPPGLKTGVVHHTTNITAPLGLCVRNVKYAIRKGVWFCSINLYVHPLFMVKQVLPFLSTPGVAGLSTRRGLIGIAG